MTVLVTGGAGYIGSHTCVELLAKGYDVVVVDNLVNSSAKAVERVEQIAGKDVSFYEVDVRDRGRLDAIFSKHDVGCVIHFAGLKAVGERVVMPLAYYDNNLFSTVTLCEVMREHKCKNIIFSSSATVYSGDNEMPLRETSKTGMCTNPYGWTKYMSEQIMRDMAFADKEWSVSLLRYFNPIGAHSSGLIGEDPEGVPNNLFPYIAQVAAGRRERVLVYGDDYATPDGTGVRDYLHVMDLARGHVAALERLGDAYGMRTYNLGSGHGVSVLEAIAAFERACGKTIPYEVVARRPGDIAVCYADPSAANRDLGWKTAYTLDEACAHLWRWQTMNPNGFAG